ncbi:hypothetical protein A6E13_14670 [Aliivibrio fischeri]|nr:hypothetical protein A6E09_03385 [Aliivibrio fischeri]OCH07029.1 hypothetical protein A6E10_04575 [Aliivibrio fischeri]OCH20005.1 hypothetical protein A6E12_04695 [Aliivibrio fischeri]OCH32311.1 hypothetical protein A6E13_14670 [Aliivibrio fischeri]
MKKCEIIFTPAQRSKLYRQQKRRQYFFWKKFFYSFLLLLLISYGLIKKVMTFAITLLFKLNQKLNFKVR